MNINSLGIQEQLEYIREQLGAILDSSCVASTHGLPIEFENEFGKFKAENDDMYWQPKTAVQYITINTVITPTGATYEK